MFKILKRSYFFKLRFIFVFICIFQLIGFSQQPNHSFLETEYTAGKIVPNYSINFPSSSIQQAISLSYGKKIEDKNSWGKYYNYPEVGLSIFATNLGNNKIYGNQISILPFIRYNVSRAGKELPTFIKLSIGASYFTKYYNSVDNTGNVAVGSPITWGFQAMLYKVIYQKEAFNLKLVGGYSHHSNGHTQIPNFGLNSALFGVSAYWDYQKKTSINETSIQEIKENKKYSLIFREGIGFHELGGTSFPIGGEKKCIYSNALSFGVLLKNHIRFRMGFSYRFYQHYYDYVEDSYKEYIENPSIMASNFYFFTGAEFLMNHVSIDVEGGLNLYKPFYQEFNADFQKDKGLNYELKKWLNARLGLNYYLINTGNRPVFNMFLGGHINANFGQADFSELSIGILYSFD